jgi:hypothetical protein
MDGRKVPLAKQGRTSPRRATSQEQTRIAAREMEASSFLALSSPRRREDSPLTDGKPFAVFFRDGKGRAPAKAMILAHKQCDRAAWKKQL